ncbi:NUDIX domain-containing protein [Rhodococcus ruber]|uniref:NUDIX hydrolase n=1 Tax=Rhodococcus TaxID=1827 RepID=UPI0006608F2E|nr:MULTISPECIES: NUDIX domain-containing protein [Rhodococcus]AUM17309.1 NUDIX domain-containing protein [Rhodococcus ruber]MBD8054319.1 NUDIX domain-containing protein [Rhodococcus ruber]MBP2212256.1 8-oxo-dGTP pyrophosphatase MutT (NUDIX family) [Rhodococcus ruber]MCF8782174.1 NUDIX domain-containing protein [Rhodococcus ruber]MCZ1072153.1 NUDIX domain-containing protein [Rhodococcus sp. A5(2022)]
MAIERSGELAAAVPLKDASTVILVRDGDRGVEVFLLQRVRGMAFAGGMTVFPGGGVDPSDSAAAVAWAGPPVQWWSERFGTSENLAQALVLAAVRETFEECGVLLAGPTSDTVVADTTAFAPARRQLEAREFTFGEFLEREGLVLRADLLRPWSNWITPVGEGRRYDTRFFVAAAPEGQIADGDTSEADAVRWQTPQEAIAHWQEGGSVLLPPTWSQLTALSRFGSVAEILAAEPQITPILPTLITGDEELRVEFPEQDGYYEAGPHPWAARGAN